MEPPRQSCAEQDDATDQAILGLLLDDAHQLWATEELGREIGDRLATVDALRRLEAAGLVYRLDRGYVFASWSARRVMRLSE